MVLVVGFPGRDLKRYMKSITSNNRNITDPISSRRAIVLIGSFIQVYNYFKAILCLLKLRK